MKSSAESEALDELDVTSLILGGQVVEEPATTADHLEKAATSREVLLVLLHVLGQRVDLFGKNRNLNFRGPDVGIATAIFGDESLLFFFVHDRHDKQPLRLWEVD